MTSRWTVSSESFFYLLPAWSVPLFDYAARGAMSKAYVLLTLLLATLPFLVLHCAKENPTGPGTGLFLSPSSEGRIGIIVNKQLFPSISLAIQGYIHNLDAIEGKSVWLNGTHFNSTNTPLEMKDSLHYHYANSGLEGAVLVGDLPIEWREAERDSAFPVDWYFMDMDGNGPQGTSPVSSVKPGQGHGRAKADSTDVGKVEIWVSRIPASTLQGDEAEIVNAYFERVDLRMTGKDPLPRRGLRMVASDFTNQIDGLKTLYPWYRLTEHVYYSEDSSKGEFSPESWERELRKGHEYVRLVAHSDPDMNTFQNLSPFFIKDYLAMAGSAAGPSNVRFYNLFACRNALFTVENLGAYYALTQNGLLAVGSTHPGGMKIATVFDEALEKGRSFGDALEIWINEEGVTGTPDYPGIVLLGAGTLKLKPYAGSTAEVSYEITATATEGGALDPPGKVSVREGKDQLFMALPEEGYRVDRVWVDSVLVQSLAFDPKPPGYYDDGRLKARTAVHEFQNVKESHVLRVAFVRRIEDTIGVELDSAVTVEDQGQLKTQCSRKCEFVRYRSEPLVYKVSTDHLSQVIDSLWMGDSLVFEAAKERERVLRFEAKGNLNIRVRSEHMPVCTVAFSVEGEGSVVVPNKQFRSFYSGSHSYRLIPIKGDSALDSLSRVFDQPEIPQDLLLDDSTAMVRVGQELIFCFVADSGNVIESVALDSMALSQHKSNDSGWWYHFPAVQSNHSFRAGFKPRSP